MMVYWKKYEKVEKEHRKKAEKEAIEQRKIDFEMNEVELEIPCAFLAEATSCHVWTAKSEFKEF